MNHWHVHLLVPGAGPSVEGDRWVEATPPTGSRNGHGFYLVDADTLRSRFRKTLLRRLAQARAAGKLKLTGQHAYLQDDDNWTAFVNGLASKTWVAYIQPPPTAESKAHHVVNYLTRYLTGGPISDHRIVSASRQSVTFLAREGKQVGGQRTPSTDHDLDKGVHTALERAHPARPLDQGAILRWLEQFKSRPIHAALSRSLLSHPQRNRRRARSTGRPIDSKRTSSAKAVAVIEWCCRANRPNQAGESFWGTDHRRVHRGMQTSETSQIGSFGTV